MTKIGYGLEQKYLLPDAPGIYKYFDASDKLIYVGKAKNLKKRVSSYFTKSLTNRKTYKLVKSIERFDFTIVESESDALLLENNLIKQHQPKFNILLKDDKTFPYICIVKEPFPRIISTRKLDRSKGEFFGPYSSVSVMNAVLGLIRKLCTIRTCKLNLGAKQLDKDNYKVCLEYHIGNCKGPCEKLQSEEDYLQDIELARNILKGQLTIVKKKLGSDMQQAAAALKFEQAQHIKEKLDLVERFQTKSTVVNTKLSNVAVITVVPDKTVAFINFMNIENGAIVNTYTTEVKNRLELEPSEVLAQSALQLIQKHSIQPEEIYTNETFELSDLEIVLPKIGDKYKLVQLSLKNAFEYKKNKLLKKPLHDKSILVLNQLKEDLNLNHLPKHIECFDNSNIQGTNPVASMVCFKNGKPSKKDYRHYNIKTVVGPDDFSSMKEVVGRRYARLKEEALELPNLIVIDGGKGQLSSACEALRELNLYGKLPIIGIAKRLEEIYFPHDKYPIHISKKSTSLKLLQHLRDEAHRFAITFHRLKRSNSSLVSELEGIKGIGQKTREELISKFRSIKKIKEASKEELAETIGAHKASLLTSYFQAQKKED